jgi:hypothetical protein
MHEEALIRWTIRLALVCYVAGQVWRWHARGSGRRQSGTRLVWTAGCAALLVHTIFAFAFQHLWSHDDALAHTARRTAETVGFAWGGGLYFNYAFLLLWVVDVLYWWLWPERHETRSTMVEFLVQGSFLFMFFNAAVVFALGPGRWLGVAAFVVLLAGWVLTRRANRVSHEPDA